MLTMVYITRLLADSFSPVKIRSVEI